MTWIFGYGSLVYKPGFDDRRKVHGCIKGWRRVWWQGSTDHRGTPEAPGRTVTLVEDPGAVTWGVAYELPGSAEQQAATIAYLEHREKQYDRRCLVDFFPAAGLPAAGSQQQQEQQQEQQEQQEQQQQKQQQDPLAPVTAGVIPGCLVYVATDSPANRNYLGPAPLADIAAQIAGAVGPSGPNYEYLTRLAAAMREMGVDDPELFELEALVQQAIAGSSSSSSAGSSQAAAAAVAATGAVATAAAAMSAVQQGVAAGAVQQTVQLLAAAAAAKASSPAAVELNAVAGGN